MERATGAPDVGTEVDALAEAFNQASRDLVGLSIRSILAVPDGVTVPQYRVLVVLSSDGPQAVGEIARHLGVNPSNASRLCDRLQRLGLIARARSAVDGRGVEISITASGEAMVEAVSRARGEEIRRILGAMEPADVGAATAALEAFSRAARSSVQDLPDLR